MHGLQVGPQRTHIAQGASALAVFLPAAPCIITQTEKSEGHQYGDDVQQACYSCSDALEVRAGGY